MKERKPKTTERIIIVIRTGHNGPAGWAFKTHERLWWERSLVWSRKDSSSW